MTVPCQIYEKAFKTITTTTRHHHLAPNTDDGHCDQPPSRNTSDDTPKDRAQENRRKHNRRKTKIQLEENKPEEKKLEETSEGQNRRKNIENKSEEQVGGTSRRLHLFLATPASGEPWMGPVKTR